MQTSSRLKLLTLIISFGGALVGCEGGTYYDANTGRIVNGAPPTRASAAAEQSDRAPAQDGTPSAAPTAYVPAPSYVAAPSYEKRWTPPSSGGSTWTSSDGSASSFDPMSRTPPAPQIQADGTPMKPQLANVSPSSGPATGGNEVVITGSGFAGAQVMFGHQVAQVTSQSSNAISVVVPEGTPNVPATVVITNRDGTYAVAGAVYAYRG
jgi:hypothetical protein